ncbi:MAG TPA: hypothetical protein VE975_02845 [Actinomycetota bacterium]|jgi:plasmid replication initiation protein|nr:hypothetical protein [Actinomycetota bacterium]
MNGDLVARFLEVEGAARDMEHASRRLQRTAVELKTAVERGSSIRQLYEDGSGTAARREALRSWARLNQALYRARVQSVRALIDEEGFSFTETGRLLGISRQTAAALYHGHK